MRNIKGFFRSLGYSLMNLKYWFKIIWNDRNWDHEFLTQILLHKLKGMRDFYQGGKNVWSADALGTANEINEVIELLEKVEADNYEESIDPHFNDWIYNGQCYSGEMTDENGKTFYGFKGPSWTDEELEHRREVFKEAERQTQADLDKAYGLIAKNIRKWWD